MGKPLDQCLLNARNDVMLHAFFINLSRREVHTAIIVWRPIDEMGPAVKNDGLSCLCAMSRAFVAGALKNSKLTHII